MTERRLATKAGTDLYHAVVGMTGARDGSAWFEQVAAIEAEAASLDVDVLARAISKHHRRSYVDMIDTLAAKSLAKKYRAILAPRAPR